MSGMIRTLAATLGSVAILGTLALACSGGEPLTDRLLVVRDAGIVELDLSTKDETLIIPNPPDSFLAEPAVSADGSQFVYVRDLRPFFEPDVPQDFGMDIYLASADGSNPTLIQEHQRQNEKIRSPAWLPDGQSLLVVVEQVEGAQVGRDIERVDLASGERTRLVEGGFHPAVSPDGTRMVYVTEDEELAQTLWLANIDGSGATTLAGPDEGLVTFLSPRFSPDGAVLAFGGSGPATLSVVAKPAARYAARAPNQASPSASAATYNGLPMDIWLVDVAGGEPRALADLQLDLPSLAWSGDGSRIFVLAGRGLLAIDPISGSNSSEAEGTFHGHLDWLAPD